LDWDKKETMDSKETKGAQKTPKDLKKPQAPPDRSG